MADAPRTFFLDPRNREIAEGRAGRLYAGPDAQAVGLVGIGMFFVLFFLVAIGPECLKRAQVALAGVDAVGEARMVGRDFVVYSYQTPKGPRAANARMSPAAVAALREKGPIKLRYYARDPLVSLPEGNVWDGPPLPFVWIAGSLLFIVFPGGVALGLRARARRLRRLARDGVVLKGRLFDVAQLNGRYGRRLRLRYTFQTPLAGPMDVEILARRAGRLPSVGDPVYVLYLPDDHILL